MSLVTCHHPYYNSHNFFHRLSILNPESGSALSPQCLSISLTLKRLWLCALILLPPACLESNWSWSKCLSSAIRGEPSGAPGSWLTWCHLGLLQPSSCSRWKVAVSVTLLFEFWIVELFTVVIFRWRMLSWVYTILLKSGELKHFCIPSILGEGHSVCFQEYSDSVMAYLFLFTIGFFAALS